MSRHRVAALVMVLAGVGTLVAVTIDPGTATEPGADPERVPDSLPAVPADAPPRPPTTTTVTTLPPIPEGGLARGASGPEVEALEALLVERRYDPGPVDGVFDARTESAVMALEKVMGVSPTGRVDSLLWHAVTRAPQPTPLVSDEGARWVELDLSRQLLFVYERGELRLVTHTSTGHGGRFCAPGGCSVAITPVGAHRFMWRVNGWRTSRLGRLYNPVYFTGDGIAVHGYPSVPTEPASSGCARIPMHVAEYFPSLVRQGDAVYVLDGVTPVEPLPPGRPGSLGQPPVDDGGGALPPLPEGWLDGDPPPTTTTTRRAGDLA